MNSSETVTLSRNVHLPLLGFGTYLIEDQDVADIVRHAVETGYRHVDTAEAYNNEAGVGQGIRAAISDLGMDREDMFVTTKLWPGNPAWGNPVKGHAEVLASFEASLKRLEMDYVDLYMIHAPFAAERRVEQWEALIELKERGSARSIGVSNFSKAHLEELERAGLPLPDVNQIELHPWSQKPDLVGFLKEKGIQPIAYSSLVPLSTWRSKEGEHSAKTDDMVEAGTKSDSPFKEMASRYGVTEAQVLLRWAVQQQYAVLPKSTSPERIKTNADVFSFEISYEDMQAIRGMDRGDGVAWAVGDPTQVI